MKSNRKNIIGMLSVAGLLAFSPALRAQDSTNMSTNMPSATAPGGTKHGNTVDRMIQRLTTQLNLTDDQQTKIKPILESQMQQISAVRQDTTLTPEDRRTKMMAIRQATTTQMQGILTPDQFTQYQQMTQRMRRGAGLSNTNAPAATPPPQQ